VPYLDILKEAAADTWPLVPALFVLYAGLEVAVRGGSLRLARLARHADAAGPFAGALLGVVPQCGMSVFMSTLFLSGRISRGTLVATYVATSDEALPVLLAHGTQFRLVGAILAGKLVLGVLGGLLVDALPGPRYYRGVPARDPGPSTAEVEHELHRPDVLHLVRHALGRTLQIVAWVLVVTFLLGVALHWLGGHAWLDHVSRRPVLGVIGAALFGLIPNCAASIAIAEGAMRGLLPFSATMAGLSAGAGYGPIVLLKDGSNGASLGLLGLCLGISIAAGCLLALAGF
jgi:hypothetical protein